MPTYAQSFIAKFYDDLTDATVNGTVTGIEFDSLSSENNLASMADWSFEIKHAEYDPGFIVPGCYVRVYSVVSATEYLEFGGYLLDIEPDWQPRLGSANTITLSGKNDFWGLAQTTISQGEIFELMTMTPIYVGTIKGTFGSGDTEILPNLSDGNAGTSEVFTLTNFTDADDTEVSMLYIGSDAPFSHVDFDFDTTTEEQLSNVRINVQVFQVGQEFTGWGTPSGLVDSTSVAFGTTTTGSVGTYFRYDGYLEWDKSPFEKMETHDGYSLYWMRIYFTDGAADNFELVDVTVKQAGPHSSDVSEVMTNWAPAGWALSAGSETATQKTFVVTAYGDSVLAILDDLAERSGEVFALAGEAEVHWIDPDNPPASGITAESSATNEGNTNYCHIVRMSRKQSYKEQIQTVIPRGAGGDDVATVTLSDLEPNPATGHYFFNSSVPAGYVITVDPNGDPNQSYITNTNLTVGRSAYVEFPTIAPVRGGTGRNRNAADELAKSAISYLQRNAGPSVYYTATVAGLDDNTNAIYPGMTMTVTGVLTAADGTATETINETLTIVSWRKYWSREGVKYFDIKFGDAAKPEPTQAWKATTQRRKLSQKSRHPQANSAAKLWGGTPGGMGISTTPGQGGVAPHAILSVQHTTATMADGAVVGADGSEGQPVAITFDAGDFDFDSINNIYALAAAITNQLHAQSHVLATTSALGPDHTVSGLTSGQVLKATAATTARFIQLLHSELGSIGANDHHNQVHVLATTSALGADHTVSGLTAGQVLKALTATTAAFGQLLHSQLGSIGANDHHNQVHGITSSDHTVSGAAGQVVGLSATNTLGLLTPTADADANVNTILKGDASGRIKLDGLVIGSGTASSNNIIMPNGGIIGIGTSGERIRFSNLNTIEVFAQTAASLQLTVDGDVYPFADSTSTMGSVSKRWLSGHFDSLDINGTTLNATQLAALLDLGQGARVWHDTTQSATNNAPYIVAFNSEIWDDNGYHSNVTNNSRLTIPTTGRYTVTANLSFAANSTGVRRLEILLNGTTVIARDGPGVAAAGPTALMATNDYNFTAGDYVQVQVFQNSGAGLDIQSESPVTPAFMIKRIK